MRERLGLTRGDTGGKEEDMRLRAASCFSRGGGGLREGGVSIWGGDRGAAEEAETALTDFLMSSSLTLLPVACAERWEKMSRLVVEEGSG